jgi:hypothetical protein
MEDITLHPNSKSYAVEGVVTKELIHLEAEINPFVRNGRIRAVKFRHKNFRAKFFRFGQFSPKSANFWNSPKSKKNPPTNFGAKLNCADSPIFGRTRITVLCTGENFVICHFWL